MKSLLRRCDPTRLIVGLLLLCALLIGSGSLLYTVYFQRSDKPLVRQLAGWMPAARVGGHVITYEAFQGSLDAMKSYLNSPLAKKQGIDATMTAQLEKASLMRLMREVAVGQLAQERNVTVPDEDVRGSFAQMVAMSSSTIPNVAAYLKETFNWTEEEYRNNIIRPAILEERVAATMTTDTRMQFEAVQTALDERLNKPDTRIYLKF